MIEALSCLEHILAEEARSLRRAVVCALDEDRAFREGNWTGARDFGRRAVALMAGLSVLEADRREAERRAAREIPSPGTSAGTFVRLRWSRCQRLRRRVESLSRELERLQTGHYYRWVAWRAASRQIADAISRPGFKEKNGRHLGGPRGIPGTPAVAPGY